jgi:hypothetical protein
MDTTAPKSWRALWKTIPFSADGDFDLGAAPRPSRGRNRDHHGSHTRDDVLAIIAPADEMLVAEIIATEATMEELTQAWAWANNDEATKAGRYPAAGPPNLVELLTPQDDEEEQVS